MILMNITRHLFIALLLAASPALAEEIVLNDGSRIQGEVMSMSNGAYQVNTPSLGVISIPRAKVRSISAGSSGDAGSSGSSLNPSGNSMLDSIQSSMVNNPGIMSNIMQLQHDPDMQAVLSDPEVMRAVQNLDFKTLSNHPKIKKLMQNSKVREISGKVN